MFTISTLFLVIRNTNLGQNKIMAYFNYHAKAQNLIKNGHCVKAELVDKHNEINPALVLYFDNHIPMPIRAHMFFVYFALLTSNNVTIIDLTSDN